MKIKVFIIGSEPSGAVFSLEEQVRYIFGNFLAENGGIEKFAAVRDAINSISQAFADSQTVIFLVADDIFGYTKLTISKAFGFDMKVEQNILENALQTCNGKNSSDEEFALCHAGIPQGARAFVLEDGLYAGFAAVSGEQTVIFLPAESERTQVLFSMQVIPFINAKYHINADMDGLKRLRTKYLADICKKTEKTIAVSCTNTASFLMDYMAYSPELQRHIKLSPRAEKRGSLPPSDYVVNLSITAAELMGTPYGVAMSNAFYNGDDAAGEKVVYMAVTNDAQTVVREIHSLNNEDIPAFLERCCADLCVFVAGIIEKDAGLVPEEKVPEKSSKKAKGLIAALVCAIVLLAAFCGYYFHANGYTLNDWFNTYIGQFLSTEYEETDEQSESIPEQEDNT